MPIPFIIAGVAFAAGALGVKKGIDAKSDFKKAGSINEEAERIQKSARRALEDKRNQVKGSLESLGRQKANLYQGCLVPFVEAFQKIKNVDFNDPDLHTDVTLDVSDIDMLEVREVTLRVIDWLESSTAGLGGGAAAGFAAFGGAGMLAAASTGTAINTLTGVAATNATLAWFGGGSLAAGGFGMAGGMAVLGGIVAGPVLAVGGIMMASKAKQAVDDARSNAASARAVTETMRQAETAASNISLRATEIASLLAALQGRLTPVLAELQVLVGGLNDYRSYAPRQRGVVMLCAALAKTMKNVLEVPIFDEQGHVTRRSLQAVEEGRMLLGKLTTM